MKNTLNISGITIINYNKVTSEEYTIIISKVLRELAKAVDKNSPNYSDEQATYYARLAWKLYDGQKAQK